MPRSPTISRAMAPYVVSDVTTLTFSATGARTGGGVTRTGSATSSAVSRRMSVGLVFVWSNRPNSLQGELVRGVRSEEHTSELQSQSNLVCRLLLEKKIDGRAKVVRRIVAMRRGGGASELRPAHYLAPTSTAPPRFVSASPKARAGRAAARPGKRRH